MSSTKEDIKLKVNIKNFKRVSRCPICGKRPEEIEWSGAGLRIWCNNETRPTVIFEPIYPGELDLVQVTKDLIINWNLYCTNAETRLKANG